MEISLKQKMAFGVGAIGKDLVYALSANYIMYFYNEVMGISAAFVGLIMLIARVFDALNDPIMGVLVGKTKTRWGRFRPWIFTGTVVNAFVLFAMYSTPNLEGTGLMVYFSVTYILWGMTYTMMDIPFWSMIPAVTRTTESRENLSVIGRTCAGIGGAIITAFGMLLIKYLGGGNAQDGFRTLTAIVAILFIVCEIAVCLMFKENTKSKVVMETSSVKDMFKALLRNDQAISVVVSVVLFYLSYFMATQVFLYFFKYDVPFAGNYVPGVSPDPTATWEATYTVFTSTTLACMILGMMVVYPLLRKKLSNPTIFKLVLATSLAAYVVLLITCMTGFTYCLPVLIVCGIFIYMGNGLIGVLCTLFLANSVDYGQLKTGKREESMIFSMQTFVVKAGSGFAAFIAGLGIDAAGIISDPNNKDIVLQQSVQTVQTLDLLITVPAIVCLILSYIWFKCTFKLTDERSKEILEELKATGQLKDDALVRD